MMMVQKEEIKNWLKLIGQIEIKNKIYYKHPVYDLYAADMNGNVINVDRKVLMKGNKMPNGYLRISVRGQNHKIQKGYYAHRFVYECVFGLIPEGLVIDHLDNNKENNSLINLKLTTTHQNNLRAAQNRDYSFVKDIRKNAKPVLAINIKTKQKFYFRSLYATGKQLGIASGTIEKCCKKEYGCKTGISKKDGRRYKFEFTTRVRITEY